MTKKSTEYDDGEIVGLDTDGKLKVWDGSKNIAVNSGETPEEFGVDNMSELEKKRIKKNKLDPLDQLGSLKSKADNSDDFMRVRFPKVGTMEPQTALALLTDMSRPTSGISKDNPAQQLRLVKAKCDLVDMHGTVSAKKDEYFLVQPTATLHFDSNEFGVVAFFPRRPTTMIGLMLLSEFEIIAPG